jgi:hypothetical protein
MQYSVNGIDITAAMTSANGFVFVRENRLQPNSVQSIVVFFTRMLAVHQDMTLKIQLVPHRDSAVVDSLQIMVSSIASVE